MLKDEQVYPEPLEFKPERFLKDGKLDNSVTIQLETRWTLHLGSVGGEIYFFISPCLIDKCQYCSDKICPGKHLAHSILTLTAVSVLSTFDLVRKVDENGAEIEPKREYTRTGIR